MKEIIWVFGNSASGKETFIKCAKAGKLGPITDQLGWTGLRVDYVAPSIDHVKQYKNDPVAEKREDIFKAASELSLINDVILIKWQFIDSRKDRIRRLRSELPGCQHRIILLNVTQHELHERVQSKKWWKSHRDKDVYFDEENKEIETLLETLSDEFEVTMINSTAKYSIISHK